MSVFDPESFLNSEQQGALDTQLIPAPEGEWNAQIEEITPRAITDKNGEERALLNITWNIMDQEVAQHTGRDRNTVRQAVFLDLTDEGALDMSKGKNVQLGQLREALGQNDPKKAWKPADMQGQMAKVRVSHRPDQNDPNIIYADVKKVTKAA